MNKNYFLFIPHPSSFIPYSSSLIPSLSRAEPVPVLIRRDESLDHLSRVEVAAERVELGEPEVVATEVRVRRGVRVSLQVAEVLHQDEGAVRLRMREGLVLRHVAQRARARRCVGARRGSA